MFITAHFECMKVPVNDAQNLPAEGTNEKLFVNKLVAIGCIIIKYTYYDNFTLKKNGETIFLVKFVFNGFYRRG